MTQPSVLRDRFLCSHQRAPAEGHGGQGAEGQLAELPTVCIQPSQLGIYNTNLVQVITKHFRRPHFLPLNLEQQKQIIAVFGLWKW